jgi:hypothetical protein
MPSSEGKIQAGTKLIFATMWMKRDQHKYRDGRGSRGGLASMDG